MNESPASTWSPSAYREAKSEARLTYREIHRELVARGWDFTVGSVRQWGMDGSRGPKHPTTLDALRAILPGLP